MYLFKFSLFYQAYLHCAPSPIFILRIQTSAKMKKMEDSICAFYYNLYIQSMSSLITSIFIPHLLHRLFSLRAFSYCTYIFSFRAFSYSTYFHGLNVIIRYSMLIFSFPFHLRRKKCILRCRRRYISTFGLFS
jgi:hypothetical protein